MRRCRRCAACVNAAQDLFYGAHHACVETIDTGASEHAVSGSKSARWGVEPEAMHRARHKDDIERLSVSPTAISDGFAHRATGWAKQAEHGYLSAPRVGASKVAKWEIGAEDLASLCLKR